MNWFWEDPAFWPNFWAELIVAVVIVLGIIGLGSRIVAGLVRPKPQARLLVEQTTWRPSPLRLNFRIANTGKIAFRADEVRWELFVPNPPGLPGLTKYEHRTTVEEGEILVESRGVSYEYYHGTLKVPLFSGVSAKLFYSDLPERAVIPPLMYYALSTPHGHVPRKLKRAPDGHVVLSTADVLRQPYGQQQAPPT